MKAMVLRATAPVEKSPLVYMDLPDPVPGEKEVRINVACCGVCRTDLHIMEGDLALPKLPLVLGHQIVGVVDQLGPGCARLKVGMRIGGAWLRHTDGVCRFCTTGRENLCVQSRYTGFHADGGYAELAVVPEDFAYELPAQYDDISVSPLLCAGIIGYRALRRANPRRGGTLGIFGYGSSAHIVMPIAAQRGCEIYVVSRGEAHQKQAREMGAAWCGDDAGKIPRPLDAAICFAPAGAVVPEALAAMDRGAVLSLAGIHMTPIPQLDYDKYLFGERDIHSVMANTREDGRQLLAEAVEIRIQPRTVVYPLRKANEALADLKAGKIDGTGVLVMK
jgi:propanol-preferring alcohol dehydrogenase